jgi:single-strand DNA-binding protein
MNSVNIVGRLTRDPELRHTSGGTAVCSMGVAVDRAGMRNDEGKYDAGFFDVTAFGTQGENCAQYLTKGKLVGVSGELSWRKWEAKDGTNRNAVEIKAFRVDFLSPRDDSAGDYVRPDAEAGAGEGYGPGPDDDIPF